MKIILLGPPGVGKGTQATMVAEAYNIPHISTGDILRAAVDESKYAGSGAESYMNRGMLVPDEIIIKLTFDRLQAPDCRSGFILDGFPRTINQAKALQDRYRIEVVLNISADKPLLLRRITGRRVCTTCRAIYHLDSNPPKQPDLCDRCGTNLIQRNDDTAEILEQRLKEYHDQTRPLIEFYSHLGIIVDIDGNAEIDEIFISMKQKLNGLERNA